MKQVVAYILICPLVCFGGMLAVSDSSPWWTHFTYMLGHGSFVHYLLNGIGWTLMRPILTPARTLTAFLIAAAIPATSVPVLGWSVILYYYTGLCLASMPAGARLRLIMLVSVGFFIPWIAAWHHAVMLFAGWLIRKVERKWEKTMR